MSHEAHACFYAYKGLEARPDKLAAPCICKAVCTSRKQPAGFQQILRLCHHSSKVTAIEIAASLGFIACGDDSGYMSVIHLAQVILSFDLFVSLLVKPRAIASPHAGEASMSHEATPFAPKMSSSMISLKARLFVMQPSILHLSKAWDQEIAQLNVLNLQADQLAPNERPRGTTQDSSQGIR